MSGYFKSMLGQEWKETGALEIHLEDDDLQSVARMIQFLYTGSYQAASQPKLVAPLRAATHDDAVALQNNNASEDILFNHIGAYLIGDKFLIQGLQDYAATSYKNIVSNHWGSEAFLHSVRMLYDNTLESDRHKEIKKVIIKVLVYHRASLFQRPQMMALIEDFTELSKGILLFMATCKVYSSTDPKYILRCGKCSKIIHCWWCGGGYQYTFHGNIEPCKRLDNSLNEDGVLTSSIHHLGMSLHCSVASCQAKPSVEGSCPNMICRDPLWSVDIESFPRV